MLDQVRRGPSVWSKSTHVYDWALCPHLHSVACVISTRIFHVFMTVHLIIFLSLYYDCFVLHILLIPLYDAHVWASEPFCQICDPLPQNSEHVGNVTF